jgi:branched-chain amino acid transport system ATP-binding protein
MLHVNNIEVVYSKVALTLKGVSLEVRAGGIACLLGANGAGKSTTLKAISGVLHSEEGEVVDGSIVFDGVRIDKLPPEDIANLGLRHVLEGRRLYSHLSVEENLRLGGHLVSGRNLAAQRLRQIYDYFPVLHNHRAKVSGFLSGGEQQMLVIGRSLMSRPRLLLLDEPSLGLAPLIVEKIFQIVHQINREEDIAILLVEQNARLALSIAEKAYIMESGRIVMDGSSEKIRANEDVREFYLGMSGISDQKKKYRDIKHYRRRKRWVG